MKEIVLNQDSNFFKKLKSIFFEYYKQGFLYGHYILNNGSYLTKGKLKSSILEDFNFFFEDRKDNQFTNLKNSKKQLNSSKLNFSDIILENGNKSSKIQPKAEKILTICPLCEKKICAKDINIEEIELSKIKIFPFNYIYIHSHNQFSPHALIIYFDAHFNVRGREVAKFTNLKTKID